MTVLGLFAAAWLVALSGALMPGPLLTVTVNESLHRGIWAGPLIVAGHALLELALVIALLLGLQHLLTLPLVELGLSVAGGIVLSYLGFSLLQVAKQGPASLPWEQTDAPDERHLRRWLAVVRAGVVTSLVNPYWELWWVTIGAAMLFQARAFGGAGVAAFYVGHIMGDLIWYTVVSLVVVSGRRWLNVLAYRLLMGVCGGFLLALAVYFGQHAFTKAGELFF